MSSLYNLEPQPTASCILHTTSGDISLELFAQQTPLACRNFLQHCLDGYYEGTLFHRLVAGFILQGGDPTSTGSGGESIYDGGAFGASREAHPPGAWPAEERKGRNAGPRGVGFRDEFHSRLKFNRRGLLGMANEGVDSNGSQFFLTLGETPELQGRNTLFGRVEGDTIYNLARMGEEEVDEATERPLYPVRVTGTEILVNPFKDMIRRTRTAAPVAKDKPAEKKKKKKKVGKQLLSFGDEEGAGEEVSTPPVKKAKFDRRIVMEVADSEPAPPDPTSRSKKTARKSEYSSRRSAARSASPASPPPQQQAARPACSQKAAAARDASPSSSSASHSPGPQIKMVSSLLDQTNAQIAELKASMRRNVQAAAREPERKKSALEQMVPATSVRGRKRKAGGGGAAAQNDLSALNFLKAFQAKLDRAPAEKEPLGGVAAKSSLTTTTTTAAAAAAAAPAAKAGAKPGTTAADENDEGAEAALCDLHFIADCQSCQSWDAQATAAGGGGGGGSRPRKGGAGRGTGNGTGTGRDDEDEDEDGNDNDDNGDDDNNDEGWMSHALSFKADRLGKDLSCRKKAEDELVVIDPREKARSLKEERRAGREARAAGGTRAWDQKLPPRGGGGGGGRG